MLPLDGGLTERTGGPSGLNHYVRAWRAITLLRWVWTTAIALFFLLANFVGLLVVLVNPIPSVIGPQLPGWNIAKTVGGIVVSLAAGYCFLLAISVVEADTFPGLPPTRKYAAAGLAACCIAILIEIAIYVVVPSFAPKTGGLALPRDSRELLVRITWSAASFGLSGGLALAVYVRFRSVRLAREAFNAAELARVDARREVLLSRLAAMQARVEPRFLLGTLSQVEALYERDPRGGDCMLDGLIAYLRAALPQLRSQRSTLNDEVRLAESYLRVIQMRMGSRLHYQVDVDAETGSCDFPPMVLLPLIDEALRNGLEPLPLGGTIVIAAETAGYGVRVSVTDDGLPRVPDPGHADVIATLRERLRILYGTAARLELPANTPRGGVTAIEIPLAAARDHC